MSSTNPDSRELVLEIFRELIGNRADRLRGDRHNVESASMVGLALQEEYFERTANDIAFHLTDWNCEAAFIVALHLFPERFTAAQICDGVDRFLIHAPEHISAAAKLGGHPVEDIFDTDGLMDTKSETQD